MKKLIFVFVALFTLILISGCGTRQNTIRYNNGSESAEDIPLDDEGQSDEVTNDSTNEQPPKETDSEIEEVKESENAESTEPTGKLAVTSFDGAFLKTNLSYNVVKGTSSSDTDKITINDYKLRKYIPGSTKWDYIASTRFSTLKNGLNSYVLKTYDADGAQIDSLIFSINYDAPVIPTELPGVGVNHWLAILASLIIVGSYAVFRRFRWL